MFQPANVVYHISYMCIWLPESNLLQPRLDHRHFQRKWELHIQFPKDGRVTEDGFAAHDVIWIDVCRYCFINVYEFDVDI